jgi:hypothetical protein
MCVVHGLWKISTSLFILFNTIKTLECHWALAIARFPALCPSAVDRTRLVV